MAESKKDEKKGYDKSENAFDSSGGGRGQQFIPGLKDGDARPVRFLAEPTDKKHFKTCFRHRWVKGDDGNFKGDFTCLNSKENLQKGVVCPLCEKGLKPTPRFFTPVIDRADGALKILDQGRQVYDDLMNHSRTNETITNIDFLYSRKGSGQFDTEYSLAPQLKTMAALTDAEKTLLDKLDLDKIIAEKKREDILSILSGKKVAAEATTGDESEDVVPF